MMQCAIQPLPLGAKGTRGFTLIELSIVLVIIGLIVGGVLMGQDLIKGASVRAAISSIQQIQTASSGFRDKMLALPGDITPTAAASFGLATRTGAAGMGDGNDLIEATGGLGAVQANGETQLYWNDLATANMVKGSYGGLGAGQVVTAANLGNFYPILDLRKANLIAYSAAGMNYYQLTKITSTTATTYTMGGAVAPAEALSIDAKMDDGNGLTGSVIVVGGGIPNTATAAVTTGPNLCLVTTAGNTTYQNTLLGPVCQLRIRM